MESAAGLEPVVAAGSSTWAEYARESREPRSHDSCRLQQLFQRICQRLEPALPAEWTYVPALLYFADLQAAAYSPLVAFLSAA